MAYRRSYGSRKSSGRVRKSNRSAGSRRTSYKPVRSRSGRGSRSRYAGRSARGVPQVLRIELAPGLSAATGGFSKPVAPRRTRHF